MTATFWILVFLQLAAQGAGPDSDASAGREEKGERLEYMNRAAADYRVVLLEETERPLKLIDAPLLRFDDPVTKVPDGAVYAWTTAVRPEAIVCIWFSSTGTEIHEFQSLSRGQVVASRDGQPRWYPSQPGVDFLRFEDYGRPSSSESIRAAQLRGLARRFSASVTDPEFGRQELRLLPQPLYRYGKADSPVLDGAVFAFVKGTNPEVLVLIEALDEGNGEYHWHCSPGRMTNRECSVTSGEKVLWDLPAAPSRKGSREHIYFNEIFR